MNLFIARSVLLGAVAWALLTLPAAGQATIDDPDASASDLAARLDGPGVTITNPSIPSVNGSDSPQQYGLFSNGILGASLAIDEGIVLTTGTVADALGPNNDDNASLGGGTPYLDSDIAGIDTLAQYNAAILTFDVTLDSYATGFEIDYQFGSEEYPDYVGSRFNDVFAFFLSGPGVSGTENIAQAPLGGNVRINNINIGTVGCSDDGTSQDLSQSAFYQNNGHVTSLPGTCQTGTALPGPFPVTTEFNGLTTKLSARRSGLNAGATYQVKFALADVADQRWDSGVFIELISATYDVDHADAPASYGAPTHSISNPLTLGTGVTGETSGYDDAAASADSDDGVTIPTLAQGASATIPVSVTQASGNQGYLQGWIDWNGDGDFADAGEQVATDLQSASAGTSTISVPVTVPANATTSPTFARFRWSTTSGLNSTAAAPDGEVEDYALTVLAPPLLDLNSAATLGDTDRDTALAYTEGDGAPPVMPSADASAQGENDIVDLTIDIQDVFDGDEEIVTIGGESFPLGTDRSVNISFAGQAFAIDYDATNLMLNVTSDGAGPEMDEAALDALLQSLTYEHVGENPTDGDRDYDVSIMDGDGLSAFALAAITVAGVNDPPTIDFDGDDSSGTTGADYATGFAAGDAPVSMTDTDVTITDLDDTVLASGSDMTLSGFVDTGNEIVTIGGVAFTIGTANVSNVTVGSTTFEIDSDGGDFNISVAGGTGGIADWEALFASMSYEHTLAAPTPGDRVLAFNVTDPNGGTSNSATSTITVNATPIDLSLNFDPLAGTPTIGFAETVVLNLVNEGAIAATGVSVSLPLPAGWTYVTDDTGGAYDPATGLWTVGTINSGATETVEFTLVPLASGPYDLTAEVSAANETDSDSTPANNVAGEDDQADLTPSPQLGTGTSIPAPSCSTRAALDWDSETWAPGTRTGSFTYSGISVDVDIADPQGALDSTPNGPMPVGGPFYQGGLASVEATLIFETDDADLANGDVTTQIDFGQPVADVRFSLFDIDFSSLGPRLEQVTVRGFNGATPVAPVLEAGSSVSISGDVAVGVDVSDPAGASSGNGTLNIAFTSPVDRVEFDYGHGVGTDRSANPGNPGFALHDVSFCTGSAELSASKTIALFDGGSGAYALPGEDVIYTINVSNTGTGPTDTDSVVLIDRMPDEVEFFTGDIDTGGPDNYTGTDPVGFVDNGSGLTFTYASDVGFSNLGTRPADFASCTYTPTGSYDPNVTYICFNPKGQMPAGDPDPGFSVAFRARIK